MMSGVLYNKLKETGIHGIIYGITSSLQQIIAIVLIPLYTNFLTVDDYGVLGLIRISAQLFGNIMCLGISSALFRSYFDYNDEKSRKIVVSSSLLIVLATFVIGILITVFCSNKFSILIFGVESYSTLISIALINALIIILNGIPYAVFRAKKLSLRYSIIQIVSFIAGIALIIFLVKYKNMGVMGALLGQLSMSLIVLIGLFYSIRKDIIFQYSIYEVKKLLSFGIPLIWAGIAGFIFHSTDKYIIKYFWSTSEVGLYTLGYQIGMILNTIFVVPIKLVWPPMFYSNKDDEGLKLFFTRTVTLTLLLGCVLFLLLSGLSYPVVEVFADESYLPALSIVPYILLSYLVWGLESVLNIWIALKRKTIIYTIYFSIGAIINIALNFLLVPKYGYVGAALATLISFVFMLIYVFVNNYNLLSKMLEYKRLLMIVSVTCILFFGNMYLNRLNNLALDFIAPLISAVLLPLLLFILQFYKQTELARIKSVLQSIMYKLK